MTQTTVQSVNPAITSSIESGKVLVLERTFKALRALVFEAFSRAEHLSKWWAPKGWEVPYCTVDFREGGKWHYCMKCVDPNQGQFYGMESWGLGIYKEIDAPERLVYTDYFSDAEGKVNENMPTTLSTVVFEEVDGGTRLITRAAYDTEEALKTVLDMGMLQGVSDTWDRLDEHLQELQK
ncbi:SRPBCC domain-containing protein [Deinococcus roseus]|uniref:Activator of HSP90 ATPase n=1 Tax=Deinococcus roseus TaxID=392414 RepID=A0ABQ2D2A9_9DEIO|nr:SRPBCC domain-containing protein [Deinococcus roseus]GGJ36743.1 activator of HSP90 ATPase [Deinococcus roseus]